MSSRSSCSIFSERIKAEIERRKSATVCKYKKYHRNQRRLIARRLTCRFYFCCRWTVLFKWSQRTVKTAEVRTSNQFNMSLNI